MQPSIWQPPTQLSAQEEQMVTRIRHAKLFVFLRHHRHELFNESFQKEQAELEAGLRSSDAFTLRRSQILLASSRGQRPKVIAANLGCATQTVRNAIHAFEEKGVACLLSFLHKKSCKDTLLCVRADAGFSPEYEWDRDVQCRKAETASAAILSASCFHH